MTASIANRRRSRPTEKKLLLAKQNPEQLYRQAQNLVRRGRKRYAQLVIPMLRAAATAGHAMASHALATWYIHGLGVRKNFVKAIQLEEQAARSGIVDAISNLAFAYETGKGVQKDQAKAFRLYRRAATLGGADAAYEVGRCLFYGIGTRRNERLGRTWLEKSKKMKKPTD
jgi:uncharacterized protein